MRRHLRTVVALGIASLAVASSQARADFEINLYADAAQTTLLTTIVDNGVGDSNPAIGQIVVSGTDLQNLNGDISATGVQFSALNATSNASNPTNNGSLTIGGTASGTGSIYILNSATDYTVPSGPQNTVISSFSGTFTNIGSGAESFTSYYNDSNAQNGTEQPTPPLMFTNSGTGSYHDTTTGSATGTPLYSLTNFSGLTLSSAEALGFNGTTTVRAVPEPGSVALLLLGGSLLFANKIRRRRSA